MILEKVRNHCIAQPGAEECFPFDETSPVYKVMGKMFAIISLDPPFGISLKCDPEKALELREEFEGITPGFHLNKTHWNTVAFDGTVPLHLILELVGHSYELVCSGLPAKLKKELNRIENEE
ncbi:MAG: MmcQ/YjbR family DNA-binding protein [Ignavibacteriales bacterium]|mgnify:CR=1 FL=1|nr:MAG: MmcQ/YjbR family DNA-binding protein [Ignavibacteriaceae bacterium]MBW7872640.1 MmcQ/YjbR family DNA-binding protein [Ignavibacteria bacterium]MCZ2141806.1 MmcQ/YjbR family DNA-binding protein [Ignavibacteriales bacterium]OQY75615.1 MAG: MmcQ-like protein [Ignavibacteriales bacterium UTCHB3]MBV6444975.1 putative protein YjbR [Ignavibacteriaceae bacterium]